MDTKIQFQKKATILAADGTHIGSIERVVVNTNSNVLTDIVVRKGGLLDHEEKVVSIGLITETNENQIILRDYAGTLEGFPDFEERRLIDGHKNGESRSSAEVPPNIVGFPVMGTPIVAVPAAGPTRIEQNIPDGTVAMKVDARVISAEGKHVGNVESVLADPEVDQITHLTISTGMFAREKHLIPMKWVAIMGEDEVHLRVNKVEVEESAGVPVAV